MAYAPTTYQLIWDQSRGHFVTDLEATLPTGYVKEIPDLWATDDFELVIDCYEYYDSASQNAKMEFGNAATTKLNIQLRDTEDDELELDGAGTVTQIGGTGEYCRLTYTVHKDDLTSDYAGQECVLFGVSTEGATHQRTWAQNLEVLNKDGTGAKTVTTCEMPLSVEELDVTDDGSTLTAYPGRIVYLVDTTGGNVGLTLPSAAAADQQWVTIKEKHGGNRVDVVGTINGLADALNGAGKGLEDGATVDLFSDGTSWYNFNWDVYVD